MTVKILNDNILLKKLFSKVEQVLPALMTVKWLI